MNTTAYKYYNRLTEWKANLMVEKAEQQFLKNVPPVVHAKRDAKLELLEDLLNEWFPLMDHRSFRVGAKVTYIRFPSIRKHGIVKSLDKNNAEYVFVVYYCDGNWDKYHNYTAARTRKVDLEEGWIQ